jgi:hypothetical protein
MNIPLQARGPLPLSGTFVLLFPGKGSYNCSFSYGDGSSFNISGSVDNVAYKETKEIEGFTMNVTLDLYDP